jgi:hypothetical protein
MPCDFLWDFACVFAYNHVRLTSISDFSSHESLMKNQRRIFGARSWGVQRVETQRINKINIRQIMLLMFGGCMVIYATYVLVHVSTTYRIGIGSVLTPQVLGTPTGFVDTKRFPPPKPGDLIVEVGNEKIEKWADLVDAPDEIHQLIQNPSFSADWLRKTDPPAVAIRYVSPGDSAFDAVHAVFNLSDEVSHDERLRVLAAVRGGDEVRVAWAQLTRFPVEEMIPSLIWLFLKGSLFVIGVIVYLKRPDDESAERFYILCVVTLGAYIGGYHWTQIVTHPVLSTIFTACAMMLPVASLHFYLVFPCKKTWLVSADFFCMHSYVAAA